MVAGTISTMENSPPVVISPQLVQVAKPKTPRKYVILTSWASVATAILLVVLMMSKECSGSRLTRSTGDNTKDYTGKFVDSEVNEDIYVDEGEQTELITTKSEDGNIDMIYALDYRTKISAAYIPSAEECLLLAGEDAHGLDSWGTEKNDTEHVAEENLFEEDYRSSGNKVTDLSILPRAVKPYCQGKDCFWAELVNGDDEGALAEEETEEGGVRKKRAICSERYCYKYRCGLLGWRRCKRCYTKVCIGFTCRC